MSTVMPQPGIQTELGSEAIYLRSEANPAHIRRADSALTRIKILTVPSGVVFFVGAPFPSEDQKNTISGSFSGLSET